MYNYNTVQWRQTSSTKTSSTQTVAPKCISKNCMIHCWFAVLSIHVEDFHMCTVSLWLKCHPKSFTFSTLQHSQKLWSKFPHSLSILQCCCRYMFLKGRAIFFFSTNICHSCNLVSNNFIIERRLDLAKFYMMIKMVLFKVDQQC